MLLSEPDWSRVVVLACRKMREKRAKPMQAWKAMQRRRAWTEGTEGQPTGEGEEGSSRPPMPSRHCVLSCDCSFLYYKQRSSLLPRDATVNAVPDTV